MAQQALNRSLEIKSATRAVRVSRSSLRCKALNVQHQAQGPPPAWDKRVVVPEVQPRDTPKVCVVTFGMLAEQLGAERCHKAWILLGQNPSVQLQHKQQPGQNS